MSSSTVSSSKIIDAPIADAITLLHDPPRLAGLNPLVVSVTQSHEDASEYTIVDEKISLWGRISIPTLPYNAKFLSLDDGVNVDVRAMGVVKLQNQWRAKALGEDQCEVTETILVDAPWILKSFVMRTLKQSHVELLEAMASQLEKRNEATSS